MNSSHEIDELLHRLAPHITASPADDPHNPTAQELRTMITTQPPDTSTSPTSSAPHRPPRPRSARRLVLVGGPVAIGLAAAVGALALWPSSPTGPAPAAAHALDITTDGDLIVARVSDPDADPARYAAEFAERGLDVDLSLVPASPTAVGTLIYLSSDAGDTGTEDREVEVIDAPDECQTGGGGCPVGIRIPEDYGSAVQVVFGREAEPGERYDATNDAAAPGEALEGVDIEGRRVSDVFAILENHGQSAVEFHTLVPGTAETMVVPADEVPGDWYVYQASLWGPGEVMLDVGTTPEEPQPAPPANPPTTP